MWYYAAEINFLGLICFIVLFKKNAVIPFRLNLISDEHSCITSDVFFLFYLLLQVPMKTRFKIFFIIIRKNIILLQSVFANKDVVHLNINY